MRSGQLSNDTDDGRFSSENFLNKPLCIPVRAEEDANALLHPGIDDHQSVADVIQRYATIKESCWLPRGNNGARPSATDTIVIAAKGGAIDEDE